MWLQKGSECPILFLSNGKKWKKCLDKKKSLWGTIFGCLPHKLNSMHIVLRNHLWDIYKNYLSDQNQRVKNNDSFSNSINILHGVPQGSTLVPLLFNIFLCDLFLFLLNTALASYADHNTPYAMNKSTNKVVRDIKMKSEWFFYFVWKQYES